MKRLPDPDRVFQNLQGGGEVSLAAARGRGDFDQIRDFIQKGPAWILQEVERSELRERNVQGRGVSQKWREATQPVRSLVINASEVEPGSAKDRLLLSLEPYKLIEGAILAGVALGAHQGYICVRGDFEAPIRILTRALQETYDAGLLGKNAAGSGWDFDLTLHPGARGSLLGEESALLESLEGRRAVPRLNASDPDATTLYGAPAVVHDGETLAMLPAILRRGAAWFWGIGVPESRGPRLFSLSGQVETPCVFEEAMGWPVRDYIEGYGGGVCGGWENLQAVFPGGASSALLPKDLCESVTMDYDGLAHARSRLGTAGMIVINKDIDLLEAVIRFSRFYWQQSCGQCTPCREGTGWLWRLLENIGEGRGHPSQIELVEHVAHQIEGYTLCDLGHKAAHLIQGLTRHFRPLLEARFVDHFEGQHG